MVIAIGASIVAFLGIVALINIVLGFAGISLDQIFGYVFAPFGYLLGLEGDAVMLEGTLLGKKLILNEFIAYGDLAEHLSVLDARTILVSTVSLSGFANIASMGMCISSIGTLCPEKKGTIAKLILKAALGGVLVSMNSALLVSIVTLL